MTERVDVTVWSPLGAISIDQLPSSEEFHPMCEVCGKYIFAVDPCMGHRKEEEDNDSD